MFKLTAITALAVAATGASATPMLTKANWDKEVKESGKNVFAKFFAPWCGHCKAMKPAWDALSDKFAADTSVLIADVDCTVEDKLCGDYGVRGYPTIKYFKSENDHKAEDYNGGRDAAALEKFVETELQVPCTPAKTDGCTDKQKEYLKKMDGKTVEELKKELERLNKMGAAKVAKDKLQWLNARKGLLPHIIKSKEGPSADEKDDMDEEL